jgi:hypothetical protein
MRTGWWWTRGVLCAALGASSTLLACGSSDDAPTPGLTANQCPATPTNVTTNAVAPFWDGLYTVNASVLRGSLDNLEVSLLDPTQNTWQATGELSAQQADGTYLAQFQPQVTDQSKTSAFQVRVRARLSGCAPSAWADAGSIMPGDPLADTSWTGTWDPAEISGSLTVNRTDLTGGSVLPASTPTLGGTLTHTFAFKADGTLTEDLALSLAESDPKAPFAGCMLSLHYTGTWTWLFSGRTQNIVLSARVPADDAVAGSQCAFPAPKDLALADAKLKAGLVLAPSFLTPNIDYTGLLSTPMAAAVLDDSQLAADLSAAINQLSYSTDTESGTLNGDVNPVIGLYTKQ